MQNMKKKTIPKFKNVDEEREFWLNNDSTEYIDWSNAKIIAMSKLKPSTKKISLRLSEPLLNDIKIMAHKKDVPYQSLIKIFLSEKVAEERK